MLIRRGYVVLEVERGNSARSDARCVGEPHCPVQASEKQPSVFVVHCLVQGENVFTRMV